MNTIEQILLNSPWWNNPDWEKEDRSLVAASQSGITLRHLESYRIKFPCLEIIRGPRQIGKTTEIKMIIKDLIDTGRDPKSIGYFTGDIISKHRELFEILKSFYQHLELNKIKNGVFFIDEVTSIKDWQKAVKGFIDLSLGRNIHLVVTGSSSMELKRGYERMPGRRNGGNDHIFLPFDFRRFCILTNPDRNIPCVKFMEIVKRKNNFEKFKEHASLEAPFYRKSYADYLKTGGFPRSISDFISYKEISSETLFINQSVLFSEFEKYRKSITTLMQIMGEIIKNISQPISYNTIMKNVELASANTVKEYIESLVLSYLGVQVFCVDISRKRIFNKKDKKIYLMDPVIFRVLEEKFKISLPAEGNLSENMAAVHISRIFKKSWVEMGTIDKLYYWRSAKGNEVDFVIFLNNKPFGIEIKYQNVISKWDEMSIRKGIGKGIIITKNTFEYGEIPKIPLWAFLLLDMN